MQDNLVPGTYRLTVNYTDGRSDSRDYQFNGLVNLPMISSSSFRKKVDDSGLTVYWDKPDLSGLPPGTQTAVWGELRFYEESNRTGSARIHLPSDMNFFYIPTSALALFGNYDYFTVNILLHTTDKNNWAYSNTAKIDNIPFVHEPKAMPWIPLLLDD